ncbi:MAG: Gfo/Idh/MocA family oxidoreductase [Clostridia bacterium]|nr:Gfo/Idh/MocA family oxidoreductase [Clostridia bacterium]
MRKIKIAIVGYGNRGQVYADYSLDEPNEVEIVAVIDPNVYKLQVARDRYSLSEGQTFTRYADFIKSNIDVDIVVNATMEQQHYHTAIEILKSGHDMLIEKPIVSKREELDEIVRLANEKNCKVFVCHVLRYSPFYKSIKALIDQGEIGKIVSMEMNEHVWVPHFLTSYVRGKWNSEKVCGSPILLAKCCHDMDLICWLNPSKPESVSCFGHRSYFVKENKPENATEFCYNCPREKECKYSAIAHYIRQDVMPFLVWDSLDKPYDQITLEEKMEFLKTSDYGRCAYSAGGDVMDRQNLIVDFEDKSVVAFTLSCGTSKPDRYIHIVGTDGEIEGKLEENKFIVRKYDETTISFKEEIVDLTTQIINKAKYGGHSGGDYGIMNDLVRYLNGERASLSITHLHDSVASHLLVYGAEESRKTQRPAKV